MTSTAVGRGANRYPSFRFAGSVRTAFAARPAGIWLSLVCSAPPFPAEASWVYSWLMLRCERVISCRPACGADSSQKGNLQFAHGVPIAG
jgi:hypothetical protein